jgi:glyoxylase-like metal-dependent hydrolase (beta-lactamase superfamily II)
MAHIVHHQPTSHEEILDARAAMAACPVAAIRSETLAQKRHRASSPEEKDAMTSSWTDAEEELSQQMALSPKVNGLDLPFPRLLLYHDSSDNSSIKEKKNAILQQLQIYNVGHHNEASFGATPYLFPAKVQNRHVWIMVDTPKFSKSAVQAVTQLTGPSGPDYLFLTHVDDTADHDQWAQEFAPSLQRIFHAGDTGRNNWRRDETLNDVEILLPLPEDSNQEENESSSDYPASLLAAYDLEGTPLPSKTWLQDFLQDNSENDVVVLHTPGHSPGSITLWKKPNHDQQLPGVLFTGDTYSFTTRGGGKMTGFPRYGNNLSQQAVTLKRLLQLEWDIIAPGHGHPRDYTLETDKDNLKVQEMEQALLDLHK